MTKDELARALLLPAGPELDRLVAVAAGMELDFFSTCYCPDLLARLNERGFYLRVFQYGDGDLMVRFHQRGQSPRFGEIDAREAHADTLPLAISRAVLGAVYEGVR